MANQGYPQNDQEQMDDQGALTNRQTAGFGPGNEDTLGENMQTDVSDVGAQGGRATTGRSEAGEHGLGMAGQDALGGQDTGMNEPGTGARQTRSDMSPGGLTGGDREADEGIYRSADRPDVGMSGTDQDRGMSGLAFGTPQPGNQTPEELDQSDQMGGYRDQGIEQVGKDMGQGGQQGRRDVGSDMGPSDEDIAWGTNQGAGNTGQGVNESVGDVRAATGRGQGGETMTRPTTDDDIIQAGEMGAGEDLATGTNRASIDDDDVVGG